jgi:hypothetical protein
MSGKLKDDGTLAGDAAVSVHGGRMNWTAERMKKR